MIGSRRASRPSIARRGSRIVFWAIVTIVLAASYAGNHLGVVPQQQFEAFQRDTEAHILGRLALSRDHGLLAAGGLTGLGLDRPPPQARRFWPDARIVRAQYHAYLEGESHPYYWQYRSQPGGQAMLLGALDRLLPLSPVRKLSLFHGLFALLAGAMLALVALGLRLELGWGAASAAALAMLGSTWLTLFGRNLWWSSWAFFLPLVAVHLQLRRRRLAGDRSLRCGAVVFGALSVKCWLNGYEYLTTTVAMLAVPFVYAAIVERPGRRRVARGAAGMAVGAMAAVALSAAMLSVQVRAADGSWRAGPEHLLDSLGARTVGSAHASEPMAQSERARSRAGLLRALLAAPFADFRHLVAARSDGEPAATFRFASIRHSHLLVPFVLGSVLLLALGRRRSPAEAVRRQHALVVAAWFSLLAPLSWLVIFRAHTVHHLHINPITWQMPFTLLGFAVLGAAVESVIRGLRPTRGW
jgi:hypothetical protein